MGEQILSYDPVTFKKRPPVPGADSLQNENYTRHTDPQETSRDYSRPHSIPEAEYEMSTGRNWAEDCNAWKAAEAQRIADEKRKAQALAEAA